MSEEFIAGIHNYCDRWCEKCAYAARCRVAEMESGMTDDEKDVGSDAFVRNLQNIFADARKMLEEGAAKFGIDLEEASQSPEEFKRTKRREADFVRGHELTKLGRQYMKEACKTLDRADEWASGADDDLRESALETLGWYLHFISAKTGRALGGLIDHDGSFLENEIRDSQSDANGSMKIALIAVYRSIAAWKSLMTDENADIVTPHVELLKQIGERAEAAFPHAREFVRPGFDEIETVM